MANETTLEDVVESVNSLYDALVDLLRAVEKNTEAVNRWGSEIESRLSFIESNTG